LSLSASHRRRSLGRKVGAYRRQVYHEKPVGTGHEGQEPNVRIPLDKYFFQVNFTDGYDEDDCSAEFDELVRTIKVGRAIN